MIRSVRRSVELSWRWWKTRPNSLTRPSFNGLPIGANSSFDTRESGKVLAEVTGRGSELSREDAGFIEQKTGDLHRKTLSLITPIA